ncbi:MAG: hypothetical protein VW625_11125 [Perlucidibaca sp.]
MQDQIQTHQPQIQPLPSRLAPNHVPRPEQSVNPNAQRQQEQAQQQTQQ